MGTYPLCHSVRASVRAWELMGIYGNFVRSNSVRACVGTWKLMGTLCGVNACVGTPLCGVTPCVRGNWELMGMRSKCVRGNFGNLWELCAE